MACQKERMARGFEIETKDYKDAQNARVTERNSRNHGPLSQDEGGFRIPMQPRVSPVKRQRALALGSPVLDTTRDTSSTGSEVQMHGAFATSPMKSKRKSSSLRDDSVFRAPIMDEQLSAYGLDLNLHDRRKAVPRSKWEHKIEQSATSKARECKRKMRKERNLRLESYRYADERHSRRRARTYNLWTSWICTQMICNKWMTRFCWK